MNQAELFTPQAPCLSPRLKWIQKHRIQTRKNPNLEPGEAPWEACQVFNGESLEDALMESLEKGILGTGETEEDALAEWAQLTRTPLWHEEAHLLEEAWKQITRDEFLEALESMTRKVVNQ